MLASSRMVSSDLPGSWLWGRGYLHHTWHGGLDEALWLASVLSRKVLEYQVCSFPCYAFITFCFLVQVDDATWHGGGGHGSGLFCLGRASRERSSSCWMNLKVVSINIPMSDVLKVLAHFGTGKSMPILFLNISPGACNKVRMMLKMTNSESYFFDIQSNDVTRKRITEEAEEWW